MKIQRGIIVVDTETTGLDPHTHEITELAAIALNPWDFQPHHAGKFHMFLKPQKPEVASARAIQVAKESYDEAMANGIDQKVGLRHFIDWCDKVNDSRKDSTRPMLCGHNCPYDYDMITESCKRHKLIKTEKDQTWDYHVIDTWSLMWILFENNPNVLKYNFDTFLDQLGLVRKKKTHGAMEDVELCVEVLQRSMAFFRKAAKRMDIKKV